MDSDSRRQSHGLDPRAPARAHTASALQRSLSASDPRPGSASSGIWAFGRGTRLLIGRLRRRRAGQREKERREGAGASRRNDATPRLLKGTGRSRGGRRKRVPEARAGSRLAERGAERAGRARAERTGRAPSAGGSRGPAGRLPEPPRAGGGAGAAMAEGSAVSDPQHATRLLRALSSFREESRFCDAHLVLDGEEIPVQKNILAAASPYIR